MRIEGENGGKGGKENSFNFHNNKSKITWRRNPKNGTTSQDL
jgi:hypothetical protein